MDSRNHDCAGGPFVRLSNHCYWLGAIAAKRQGTSASDLVPEMSKFAPALPINSPRIFPINRHLGPADRGSSFRLSMAMRTPMLVAALRRERPPRVRRGLDSRSFPSQRPPSARPRLRLVPQTAQVDGPVGRHDPGVDRADMGAVGVQRRWVGFVDVNREAGGNPWWWVKISSRSTRRPSFL